MNEKNRADDSSVDLFALVDSICDDFRSQWKSGKRPKVSDFIAKAPANAASQLFRLLLPIDIRYRKRSGEHPSPDDYLKVFPQFRRFINDAFHQSVSLDDEVANVAPRPDSENFDATIASPAVNKIGDYQLVRELGRGAFGIVYEAKHSSRGNRVALKTLPTGATEDGVSPDRLHRFRREFRSLSEINHPNLVGMQTLEVDDGKWFFTMDLIEGTDFLDYVRPDNVCNEDRLRLALSQLVQGTIALHERGIVHRDLKPSNVLVDADGRVVILDFGLVAQLKRAGDVTMSRSGMFAGTPRYAAPEQLFGERSESSDWYAIGTMLYEAVTGESPFTGGQMDVLRQKQEHDPEPLSKNPAVPPDLADLVDGLLKREPQERLSADEIVATLRLDPTKDGISTTHRSRGSSASEEDDGVEPLTSSGDEVILVGREDQLRQLEAAKQKLIKQRTPFVTWITGKSGEGKSALAETFLRPIRQGDEALVLSGRCYDRESVPFKAIDCIIDPLVAYLRSSRAREIRSQLPDDMPFLAQLFPLLRRVESIAAHPIKDIGKIDSEKVRARGFYALRDLLVAISRKTPVVLLVDDLQWADSDSAQAYVDLLTGTEPPSVLLLGSYRSDEANNSSFLREWDRLTAQESRRVEAGQISVDPLTRDQCIELAAIQTGVDRNAIKDVAGALCRDTGGNPYFLQQLLDGLDPETGVFRYAQFDEIVSARLERLPSTATDLLRVVAVSGQPISLMEASQVVDQTTSVPATITHMRSERLVRLIGSRDQLMVDTYHDKIRETVLEGLSAEQKRTWHLRLAETIQESEGLESAKLYSQLSDSTTPGDFGDNLSPRVFELAKHFHEAGDTQAFVYQLLSAELSLRAFATEEAIRFYQHVEASNLEGMSSNLLFRIHYGMGRAYQSNSDVESSVRNYQSAADLADERFDKARAYAGIGHAYAQVARLNDSIDNFDKALHEVRSGHSSVFLLRFASLLADFVRIVLLPASWWEKKPRMPANLAHLKYEIYAKRGRCAAEKNGLYALYGWLSGSVAALRSGRADQMALGYATAGNIFSFIGAHRFGRVCLTRSNRFDAVMRDPSLRGPFLESRGHASYWSGDAKGSIPIYEEAIPFLRRTDTYLMVFTQHHLRHARAYVDTAVAELDSARLTLENAELIGNAQCICWGTYDVAGAHARHGELSNALAYMFDANAMLTNERYRLTEAIRGSTDAFIRLQCSDYGRARELSDRAWRKAVEARSLIDTTLLCVPILIESLPGADWTNPLGSRDAKYLKKCIRHSKFVYRILPNHQAHILRTYGRASASFGKMSRAVRYFEKAVKIAAEKSMDYQRAKCLLDLAAVKEAGRDENRAEAIGLLKKMESVIPRAESWLLGDQYDESVVAPEFDLQAWEREQESQAKNA